MSTQTWARISIVPMYSREKSHAQWVMVVRMACTLGLSTRAEVSFPKFIWLCNLARVAPHLAVYITALDRIILLSNMRVTPSRTRPCIPSYADVVLSFTNSIQFLNIQRTTWPFTQACTARVLLPNYKMSYFHTTIQTKFAQKSKHNYDKAFWTT